MRLPHKERLRPIRIVHVCNGLAMGGMEKLLVEFARQADRRRFALHMVALRGTGPAAEEIAELGWPVTALHEPEGKRLGLVPRLVELFRRLAADVVHTHNTKPLLYAGAAARLARVPGLIHTRHGQRFGHRGRQTMMFRWASRIVDRMVCVSGDSARIALDEGVNPQKVCTIMNGVDVSRFAFTGPAEAGPAVMVGRLNPMKDAATLIRATRIILNEHVDFRLEVAGDGPCMPELRRLVASLGLEDRVRLLGQVDDVPELLRRASMCVLSSLTEGIPLTLLEALAVGLPVVATRVGGNVEVVKEGETGLLVPPATPEALAAAVCELWVDPVRRHAMGRSGRARAEAVFDVRQMVGRYEALYGEILGMKARNDAVLFAPSCSASGV